MGCERSHPPGGGEGVAETSRSEAFPGVRADMASLVYGGPVSREELAACLGEIRGLGVQGLWTRSEQALTRAEEYRGFKGEGVKPAQTGERFTPCPWVRSAEECVPVRDVRLCPVVREERREDLAWQGRKKRGAYLVLISVKPAQFREALVLFPWGGKFDGKMVRVADAHSLLVTEQSGCPWRVLPAWSREEGFDRGAISE